MSTKENKTPKKNAFDAIRRILWITMGMNLVPTVVKLVVGYLTHADSLIADGFDSLFDSLSNVVGLVGIHFAEQPADKEHPYGHRKVETMTALIVSMLLFITTWELCNMAIDKLRFPDKIIAEVNVWSFVAIGVSLVFHIWVVLYELKEGRRLNSDFLVADAMHTRADLFVSLSVAGGLTAILLGFPLADPILTLVIAILIANIGIGIIRESMPTLVDQMTIKATDVEAIVLSVPGVQACYNIRSRGQENEIFMDLRIQVQEDLCYNAAHGISHEVQRRIRDRYPNVQDIVTHLEPGKPDPSKVDLKDQRAIAIPIREIAEKLGISIHNIWVHEIESKIYVDVHIEIDGTLTLERADAIATELRTKVQKELPQIAQFTSHLEPRGQRLPPEKSSTEETQVAESVKQLLDRELGKDGYHDFNVYQINSGFGLSVYYKLPKTMIVFDSHDAVHQLELKIRKAIPVLNRIVIHSEPQ